MTATARMEHRVPMTWAAPLVTAPAPAAELAVALALFEGEPRESVIGARRMIDPLLDLWAVAAAVGPETAAPVESLLTKLVQRQYTTAAELGALVDEVRRALIDPGSGGDPARAPDQG